MKTKLFIPALCALMMCLVACGKDPKGFSVAPNKQVKFAPGNLQYQASTNTWRFAENQYDIIGEGNKNISDSYDGWIDLFGWFTGFNPTNASTDSNDYGNFADWGLNKIADSENEAYLWDALTLEEWDYLFTQRKNAAQLYGSATVNGQTGIIIIPDNIKLSVAFSAGMNGYSQNTYSTTEWEILENEGAVFLPAAGIRNGTGYMVDNDGYYWSGTPLNEYGAYHVVFFEDLIDSQSSSNFNFGHSVRLARVL